MYRVIYFQFHSKYIDEIEDLSEIYGYEEDTLEGSLWYDCTIDENNNVIHVGTYSKWSIGELYDEEITQ